MIHDAYAIDLTQNLNLTRYSGGTGAGITAKQDRPSPDSSNAITRRMRAGQIIHAVESQKKHRAAWLRTCYAPSQFCSKADFDVVIQHIKDTVKLAYRTKKDEAQGERLIEARALDARLTAFGGKGITLADIQNYIGVGTGRWYSSIAWRDSRIKAEMNRLDGVTLGYVGGKIKAKK